MCLFGGRCVFYFILVFGEGVMLTVIERSRYQFRHSESGWIPKILQQTFQCYQVCNAQIGRIIRARGHSEGVYNL